MVKLTGKAPSLKRAGRFVFWLIALPVGIGLFFGCYAAVCFGVVSVVGQENLLNGVAGLGVIGLVVGFVGAAWDLSREETRR